MSLVSQRHETLAESVRADDETLGGLTSRPVDPTCCFYWCILGCEMDGELCRQLALQLLYALGDSY